MGQWRWQSSCDHCLLQCEWQWRLVESAAFAIKEPAGWSQCLCKVLFQSVSLVDLVEVECCSQSEYCPLHLLVIHNSQHLLQNHFRGQVESHWVKEVLGNLLNIGVQDCCPVLGKRKGCRHRSE